jgi:3-hydroxybutyryl-CoA dehydrogenase
VSTNGLGEDLGILGSGTIARGLALAAASHGPVVLRARSEASAERARGQLEKAAGKIELGDALERISVTSNLDGAESHTLVVEAVVEDPDVKGQVLSEAAKRLGHDTILASTTSSLAIGELAAGVGRPDRFVGLHVFNPVPRMELVELAFPPEADADVRNRVRTFCERLGKHPVEVPDTPGFVVNRLLFPFLFSAARLMEESGLEPEAIDACMKLGAAHPMGPLALLDFVGLDVSAAIGRSLGEEVPRSMQDLMDEGALGRKAGRGFYDYSR